MMEELLILKKDLKSALEEINLGRIEAKEAIAGLNAKVDAYEKVVTAKQSGEIPNPHRSRPAPSVSAPPSQIPPPIGNLEHQKDDQTGRVHPFSTSACEVIYSSGLS